MGQRILEVGSSFAYMMLGAGKKDGYEVVEDALPPDVKILNAKVDDFGTAGCGSVIFLLESRIWPEVEDGQVIPRINPSLKRIPS